MSGSSEPFKSLSGPLTPRGRNRLTALQRWLSAGLWATAAILAATLNPLPTESAFPALTFLLLIHVIAIVLSIRLPGGVYTGLVNASLIVATLLTGYRQALIVAPLTAVIAIPAAILVMTALPRLRQHRDRVIFEFLWQSASITLSLLPAGWLYERLGGAIVQGPVETSAYLTYSLLVTVYFVFTFAFNSLWLKLNGMQTHAYWVRYGVAYAVNGLFIALVFSPEFASRYAGPPSQSYGGLIFYTLIAIVVYGITRTQLNLAARVADLRILNSIGQALNANLDLNDLAEAIHAEIDRRLDASSFYLALLEEEGHKLNFVLAFEEGERLQWGILDAHNSLSEYVVRTRRPLLLHRPYRKGDLDLDLEPVRSPGKSFVAVPIIADDEVIGVLGLRNFQQEYAYHQDDVRLLEIVASSAAVALQNARLYEQSRRQAHELTSLHTVSALVSASLDLDTVIESICRVVVDVMAAQKSAVFLANEEGSTYRLAGSKGLSHHYQEMTTGLSIAADPRTVVMRSGQIAIIEDLLAEPRFEAHADLFREEGVTSVLEAPLRVGERVIGTLAVYYESPRQFETRQVELLQTLAGQVAVAVENARLFAATNARRRQLEILHETSRTVNATLALDHVLRTVARSMIEGLNADTTAVLLIDDSRRQLLGELWIEASDGTIVEHPAGSLQLATAELNQVREGECDSDVIDLQATGECSPGSLADLTGYFGLEAGLALPLVLHDELFGLIVIGRRQSNLPFQTETMRLARALADQATVAIQNARLFELTDVALSRRVEEMAALETISQRMARRLDLQTVIEQVVSAALLATNAEIGELLLLDEGSGLLETAVRQGQSRAQSLSTTWPADWGIVGRALRLGKAVLVDDTSRDPDYVATVPEVRSELAVPIILDEHRLGVLNLESFDLAAFDQEQARFVSNLAEHAAIAIQNAQLFEAVQQRAEEFQTLRAIAVDLLSSTNLSHLLRVIAHQALAKSQAKDVHIYLYDQEREELTFGTSLWANGQIDVEFAKPRRDGVTYTVARTGEAQIISDPANHPLFGDVIHDPAWAPLETMLSMPLKRGDEVLGVFNIAFEQRGVVNEDLLHYLDLLASQAAVAIANARLAEATRIGRDRLQAILNSIHDGILMFDMDGRLVLVNPRVEELFELKFGECVGKRFPTLLKHLRAHFQGDDAMLPAEAIELARQIRKDPRAVTHRRYRIHMPAARQLDETSIPVINHEGDMIGRLVILRDTTREAEMESYRQEMSNMLVHDLRSPLAGVITGLHLALEEASYLDSGSSRDLIEASVQAALTSANTLLRLIEQILEISKLEAGEMSLDCEEIRLGDVAAQALDMLSGTAAEAGIVVTVEEAPDLPPVHADPDKLRRVFLNLLDNALRYTPADGEVAIRLTRRDTDLIVMIEDSGSGIPPELHERIFDRFFQGDPARRKRGVKGSGLGLTFCRLAVEAHGGRIWAEERPGGGSRFTFTLPAETPLAAQSGTAD